MELQLGLALSTNYPAKRFDLNAYAFNESSEPRHSPCLSSESSTDSLLFLKKTKNKKKKRCFQQAFDEQQQEEVDAIPPTLPLFWINTNQPNEEDDPGELDNNDSSIPNNGDEEGVVGWPPIKAWRRKFCHRNRSGRPAGNEAFMVVNVHGGGGGGGGFMSRYVKVKMEGVGIARKVDVRRHDSYEMLMDTLVAMFGRGQENRNNAYKLIYQDREGHWLHAGDVPWSCFIGCVQRLKLERRKR
ncbi:auxin-responsive protein IAA29-like [Diospyros lotus]|uniref:auxin-responsive protein IAA29-like n=1 Tax=Diospyros lotus TaxID=55363 RepID=UPI002256D7D6|nr:auxin-responsive protein IAA29-like [Diospyros lotus]